MELTQELVRKHLHYDPLTGVFTRLTSNGYRWKVGGVAGVLDISSGYIRIGLLGRRVWAHRLVFLYMDGSFPPEQVDHRNGNRADNSYANLRQCSDAQNKQNLRRRRDNTVGFTGLNERPSGFVAKFRKQYLGIFPTALDAHTAYLNAKAAQHKFQPVPREALRP